MGQRDNHQRLLGCNYQGRSLRPVESFPPRYPDRKLVDTLNLEFPLPVEVLPGAWRHFQSKLESLGGMAQLRMAVKKAGPVVTDQGNLVLDVKFIGGIKESAALEATINNLPGVLENGLFINLTHQILVGEIIAGEPKVRELVKR